MAHIPVPSDKPIAPPYPQKDKGRLDNIEKLLKEIRDLLKLGAGGKER